ncbi:beta-N-acetylhexosaminidase [Nonomuraea ferruginea]|uniref:beta-N-acetylhexosaminidase n=1 Tax=Nonomuraea ferruginea TaxID=46174 RepID=A0ABT4SXT9_9ACTN|nr:beta-N-acetylhexosaminidase [Nonomuraea ferruginea]MDA0642066.1 beta-N-acetylhexosaminidase [Nonomuraea ferruginea]
MLRRIGTASLLAVALTACGGGAADVAPAAKPPASEASPATEAAGRPAEPTATEPTATGSRAAPAADPVKRALAGMSVREKVGQLFMPVVYGTAADTVSGENQARYGAQTPEKVVAKYHLGGVILFPANVKSVGQVVGLTNGLQKSTDLPLLIGTDQENGLVSRMSAVMTRFPGAARIGATGKPSVAREVAQATGEELRALGVNLDFAPVADVNIDPKNPVIGERAYGNRPGEVAKMVGAAVKGFEAAGVAATAKHFPGHGDTRIDSHTGLPVIKHTRAQWERLDAPPFKAAIAAGVDAIMTAHIVFPKLDPSGDPATLSKPILTGLLRKELGFKGVISTDALNMAGARVKYDDGEVAVRAVLAGADLLLMPNDLPKQYQAVLKAVESGRVSKARLDESVTRLLTLKKERGLLGEPPVVSAEKAAEVVRSAEHRRLAARVR